MAGEGIFFNANRLLALREERSDKLITHDDVNGAKLKDIVVDLDSADRRLILRAKNIGS